MNFTCKTKTLERLSEKIKSENTGTAKILCIKLRVSERTIRRYIEELRNLGHEIGYCTYRQTYYYIDKTDSQN